MGRHVSSTHDSREYRCVSEDGGNASPNLDKRMAHYDYELAAVTEPEEPAEYVPEVSGTGSIWAESRLAHHYALSVSEAEEATRRMPTLLGGSIWKTNLSRMTGVFKRHSMFAAAPQD